MPLIRSGGRRGFIGDSASTGNFAHLKKSASSANLEGLIRQARAAQQQQPPQETPSALPPAKTSTDKK